MMREDTVLYVYVTLYVRMNILYSISTYYYYYHPRIILVIFCLMMILNFNNSLLNTYKGLKKSEWREVVCIVRDAQEEKKMFAMCVCYVRKSIKSALKRN